MKIKNLTGYMLGNERHIHTVGSEWDKHDSNVWICPTLAMAKKVMENSRMPGIKTAPVWTTIYKVKGQNIVCTKLGNGMWMMDKPSCLLVEGVVYHDMPYDLIESMSDNWVKNVIDESRGRRK